MLFKNTLIQKKLMAIMLLVSSIVLLITCAAFFAYEAFTFRQNTLRQLSILGKIVATNSTAALAFNSEKEAHEILSALRAETHIIAAALYDAEGNLFAKYPANTPDEAFPGELKQDGFYYGQNFMMGFEPVIQGDKDLGTLYIQSNLEAMYERFRLYGLIALIVVVIASLLAYVLSRILQKGISGPILSLAETARAVSERSDYSVRAKKLSNDELGLLTDAFNQMLAHIQHQNMEINSLNRDLEKKVRDRTKELEAANKELEAFSYSVSHDLRAPLRIINGYTNIFMEDYFDSMDDEAKKVANIISNNAKKMGDLIDDLLEFSRLGRKPLKRSLVSMTPIVNNIWEECIKTAPGRNIELAVKQLPDAQADLSTIKQVWANLISNAIKYTRNRETARVEIGAEVKDGAVVYYIKDNGSGFDMKYYNKLFGVFHRLHSPSEFEGTGVGLAIVHRIISKHRGKVWAEAKPGEGATFYFTLGS